MHTCTQPTDQSTLNVSKELKLKRVNEIWLPYLLVTLSQWVTSIMETKFWLNITEVSGQHSNSLLNKFYWIHFLYIFFTEVSLLCEWRGTVPNIGWFEKIGVHVCLFFLKSFIIYLYTGCISKIYVLSCDE